MQPAAWQRHHAVLGVRPAHPLEDAHEGRGIELGAVERAGEEEAVEARVEERRDEWLRQAAQPLALGRGGLDQRGELVGAVEGVRAAVRAVGHGGMLPQGRRCGRRWRAVWRGAGTAEGPHAGPCRRTGRDGLRQGRRDAGSFGLARVGRRTLGWRAPRPQPRCPARLARLAAPSLTPAGAGRYNGRALGDRLVVGRVALDHVAEVRLLLSQPFSLSVYGGGSRLHRLAWPRTRPSQG